MEQRTDGIARLKLFCFPLLVCCLEYSAADRRGTARRNPRTISRGRGAGISVALSVSGWTDRFVVTGDVPPVGFRTTDKSPHYPNPARFLRVESQSTNAPPPQHCSAYFLGQLFCVVLGATQCDAGLLQDRCHRRLNGPVIAFHRQFCGVCQAFSFLNASAGKSAAQSGFAGDNGASAAPPCPGIRTAKGFVFLCFMPPL